MTKVCKQAFRQTYLSTGSVKQTAQTFGISKQHAYRLRQNLRLPKFPPEPRRRPPLEYDLQLAEGIVRGMTCKEAAEWLGHSRLKLWRRRVTLGLPPFKRPPSHRKGTGRASQEQAAALRGAGLSYGQAARRLGTTRGAIAGLIHRHAQERHA